VCADLSSSAEAREAWQEPLCLRPCAADGECAPGLRCRDLPARAPASGWLRACFPGFPIGLGGSCRGAGGQLRNDLCVTGQCADLGANGLCSRDCAKAPCPLGAACATLSDGRQLCLQRCSPDLPCDRDRLLACALPNAGPLGFTVPAGAPPGPYCAPRRCTSPADCGPAGSCRGDPEGAHCVRRSD
jgi:hypothetical protein